MNPVPIVEPIVPLVHALDDHGDRVALLVGEQRITYRQLAAAVDARADELGTGPKLVLIGGSNELEPVVTYLACLRAGHPVLLAPGDDPATLNSWVSAYDPDVVVDRGSDAAWRVDIRRHASAHSFHPDLALLLTTSGSTGSSKLVRLSHRNLQANAESIATYLDIRETDRAATTLPMHYCYGLSVIHSHLVRGAGLILTTNSVLDPCFWNAFRELEGTTFPAVPFTFDLLERIGFETMTLPHLRYLTQAGGRLAPERVRHYAELGRRRGWQFVVMYGQTEATARMAYLPPERASANPSSIGIAIPGGSLEIEPIDGFPDGEGELLYRGPNVMLGYAERPEDLALGAGVEVLRTGDIARRTDEGMFEIVGRRSRLLKLFGLRIDLDQVERILAAEGLLAVCTGDDEHLVVAVVGDADPDRPRRVRRVIRTHVGLPGGCLRVVVVDDIPRLASGKPDYLLIQNRARADRPAPHEPVVPGAAPGGADGTNRDHRQRLRDLYAEVLDRQDVDDQSTFVSLGGDSLSYVEMSIALEELLGHLPESWHTTPLGELVPRARERPAVTRMETNVLLRSLAIVLVVGTHAGLFNVKGGAHVLLAIAGYNFARFQLNAVLERDHVGPLAASVLRIAVPSVIWIAAAAVVGDAYSLRSVVLVNSYFGPPAWDPSWDYWFIEALVQILVVIGILLAIPAVRRVARRHAYGTATMVLLAALTVRLDAPGLGGDVRRIHSPLNVLWIFALGWVIQRSRTLSQKLAISTLAVLSVPGFSASPKRDTIVLLGILVLVWVPTLGIPRLMSRSVGLVAQASLYIYLTHWHVYRSLAGHQRPVVIAATSLGVGLAVSSVAQRATSRVQALAHRRGRQPPPTKRERFGSENSRAAT